MNTTTPAAADDQPWAARIDQGNLELIQWIAFASMLLDHGGAYLLGNDYWLRFIGRLAFPLFALVFAWRLAHLFWTDPKRDFEPMVWRLALCALAAHLPWLLLGQTEYNIVFGFLAALLICILMEESHFGPQGMPLWIRWLASSVLCTIAARHVEFNASGIVLLLALYSYLRWDDTLAALVAFAALIGVSVAFPIHAAAIALPLAVTLYGRGRLPRVRAHLFYWLYPLHVWAIVAIALTFG